MTDLNYNVRHKLTTHISASNYLYFDNGTGVLQKIERSNFNSFLNYYDYSSSSVTTIADTNFHKLNTSTTLGLVNDNFTHSNNRVTNTVNARNCKVEANVSLSSNNGNVLNIAFYKNGTKINESEIDTTCNGAGRASAAPIFCVVNLAVNDYVEVWVKNQSSNNITLVHMNVLITEL